jgi:catechol 2,3-dioxygenase-like lactoylglutathione lyase family enzyme
MLGIGQHAFGEGESAEGVMASILDEATSGGPLLRVADRDRTVNWFRNVLGIEPLIVASDGADHPFAAFMVGGMHFAVWQLPPGVVRSRDDNDRNTYLVFTHPEPKRAYDALRASGADIGKLHESEHHSFFWFHDPDDNRYEISSPPKQAYVG